MTASHKARRRRARAWQGPVPVSLCPQCGKPGPHFVPPSLGDAGFFSCQTVREFALHHDFSHLAHLFPAAAPEALSGLRGKYRDALPSSDEVMAEKRAEALREDSHAPR